MSKRKSICFVVCFQLAVSLVTAQTTFSFADSIRKLYQIPELGYAVVSSQNILELNVLGVKKVNTHIAAQVDDKFRIGSNTKAITGFIAAQLVKQEKISWDTKFFDLFPELKASSQMAYHELTLLNLLTCRTTLFSYTYTYKKPTQFQFKGNEEEQRYQFVAWFLKQKPVVVKDSFHFSNMGYVAAALMLEKVSAKSYKELVMDLGNQIGIKFGFGNPNYTDSLQPWGHNKNMQPEAPNNNFKLNWLLAAGNIHVSLPDYVKFIQLQLMGLQGNSTVLSKEEFNFLHFGLAKFAVGWFWMENENKQVFSYNIGNPGSFLTQVLVFKNLDKAIILFANAQTDDAEEGLNMLLEELKTKYLK